MFEPCLAVTGVGSLPHPTATAGLADVLAFCPEFPYWPQLPRLGDQEGMYRQFAAGLPGLVASGWRRDEVALRALERVYSAALELIGEARGPAEAGASWGDRARRDEGALAAWALRPGEARGLYALRDGLAARDAGAPIRGLKGQITGPVSLGLSVTDEGGRPLLYEEDLMDGVARGLALKARWQESFLGTLVGLSGGGGEADEVPDGDRAAVLLSVDEPYLGTFGSAFFPYRPETVSSYLDIFDQTLTSRWGVHCCANTDWEFLLTSPARFVSFDAYAFGERLALYPAAVKAFLAAGKSLLWGIVPTAAEDLGGATAADLAGRLARHFQALAARGVPERALVRQSMLTPACGLAGSTVAGARRAMSLAAAVCRALRQEYAELVS